jgi:hypothetical protein
LESQSEVIDPQPGSSNDQTQIILSESNGDVEDDCDIVENEIEDYDITPIKIPMQDCNILPNKFIISFFVYNESNKNYY